MRLAIVLVVVTALVLAGAPGALGRADITPEVRNIPALITRAGFGFEEHSVWTEDGWLLVVQRIVSSARKPTKGPVLLHHGLIDSAATWIIGDRVESLGFILADAGYDVWLANSRGDGQSWTARNATYDEPAFWAWSWWEMARYDLPAAIGLVLDTTGAAQLGYVGHSQGTMIGFSEFALNPELASKISVFCALAPVARVGHVNLTLAHDVAKLPSSVLFDLIGDTIFNADPSWAQGGVEDFCGHETAFCAREICAVAGCNSTADYGDGAYVANLFHYYPAPTSAQDMVSFAQMVKSNAFQPFDWGSAALNEQHYGTATPPVLDPSTLACPVALFHGLRDKLADPTDVAWLLTQLPEDKLVAVHTYPTYGHGDFVWSVFAHLDLYVDVLNTLDAHAAGGRA